MTETLWVEKYRPSKIDECALPERIKSVLDGFVANKNIPNLLLHGSAGIGKTTVARALASELGYDLMFLNASNTRGIDVLRNQITQFASSASIDGNMKVVILDEFDQATFDFQAGMRAAIEDFSKTTRFIFTCNFPNKIIKPLHSRCSVIDFNITGDEKMEVVKQVFNRIKTILDTEGIQYDRSAIAEIVKNHFPDFRRIINECQRISSINGSISPESIGKREIDISSLVTCLKEKNFKGMRQWVAETLVSQDVNQLYRSLYDSMYDYLEPASIPEIVVLIANYQFRTMSCPDVEIQVVAFLTEAMVTCSFKE